MIERFFANSKRILRLQNSGKYLPIMHSRCVSYRYKSFCPMKFNRKFVISQSLPLIFFRQKQMIQIV